MKEKKGSSFDEHFCCQLEYHLCRTFRNSNRHDLKGFWCDGVLFEPTSEEELNKTHKIVTKAWIGKNGQEEYSMIIKFGKKSLSNFTKGEDLIDNLPSEESMEWIDIDTKNRHIEVRLK